MKTTTLALPFAILAALAAILPGCNGGGSGGSGPVAPSGGNGTELVMLSGAPLAAVPGQLLSVVADPEVFVADREMPAMWVSDGGSLPGLPSTSWAETGHEAMLSAPALAPGGYTVFLDNGFFAVGVKVTVNAAVPVADVDEAIANAQQAIAGVVAVARAGLGQVVDPRRAQALAADVARAEQLLAQFDRDLAAASADDRRTIAEWFSANAELFAPPPSAALAATLGGGFDEVKRLKAVFDGMDSGRKKIKKGLQLILLGASSSLILAPTVVGAILSGGVIGLGLAKLSDGLGEIEGAINLAYLPAVLLLDIVNREIAPQQVMGLQVMSALSTQTVDSGESLQLEFGGEAESLGEHHASTGGAALQILHDVRRRFEESSRSLRELITSDASGLVAESTRSNVFFDPAKMSVTSSNPRVAADLSGDELTLHSLSGADESSQLEFVYASAVGGRVAATLDVDIVAISGGVITNVGTGESSDVLVPASQFVRFYYTAGSPERGPALLQFNIGYLEADSGGWTIDGTLLGYAGPGVYRQLYDPSIPLTGDDPPHVGLRVDSRVGTGIRYLSWDNRVYTNQPPHSCAAVTLTVLDVSDGNIDVTLSATLVPVDGDCSDALLQVRFAGRGVLLVQ